MKWSVILFGYYKPRYELREIEQTLVRLPSGENYQGRMLYKDVWVNKVIGRFVDPPTDYDKDLYFVYEVTGWEKRAKPGDIIDLKPAELKKTWTEIIRKHFLIIELDNIEPYQLPGLTEPLWDTESYSEEMQNFDWDSTEETSIEFFPLEYIRKRRFSITLDTLNGAGIDTEKMLDPEIEYVPNDGIFDKLQCFDNLNDRNIDEDDNLNVLEPIVIERPIEIRQIK